MKATTFSMFVVHTFEYIMSITGIQWDMEVFDEIPKEVRVVFNEIFGDAVISYFIRHEKDVVSITNDVHFFKDEPFSDVATKAIYKICKDDCFLMDIIRIFALFSEMAMNCKRTGNDYQIPLIVEFLDGFYRDQLRIPLTILGGYKPLFTFSRQYYDFYSNELDKHMEARGYKGDLSMSTVTSMNAKPSTSSVNELSDINNNTKGIEIPSTVTSINAMPSTSFGNQSSDLNNNSKEIGKPSPETNIHNDLANILRRALEQDCIAAILAKYKSSNPDSS